MSSNSLLHKFLFQGLISVDYGAIIGVFTGKSVKAVVNWLIQHLGARIPVGSTKENTSFVFIGPSGVSATKLSLGVFPEAVCHVALRATDQDTFNLVESWLTENGFKTVTAAKGQTEKERWYGIYSNSKLGFSIHLSWRNNAPQDPAISQEDTPPGGDQLSNFAMTLDGVDEKDK
jgi:hypothetical protein